jgi:hypothetical protein
MSDLPKLQLELWELTKETLHLWTQIVGKVRLASTPLQTTGGTPLFKSKHEG